MTTPAQPNGITIYSSGMSDFVRVYPVKLGEETLISIPVKENDIGDVLASLKVYGQVRLKRPPSFTPPNANQGVLEIDPTQAQDELLTHLSGANIKLTSKGGGITEGRLIGRDTRDRVVGTSTVSETIVSVLVKGSIKKLHLEDIADLEFTDDKVKSEIEKALDANYQKIKEGSTFLELMVETLEGASEDTVVKVQYMVPMAAPKHTYRISTGKDHDARLELLAVVDNNTDEDLENFIFTVANGQPITFRTNIAQIQVPNRGFVNIVADALGHVGVEDGYPQDDANSLQQRASGDANWAAAAGAARGGGPKALRMAAPMMEASMGYSSTPGNSYEALGASNRSQAVRDEAETQELGDFQLWTSKNPMTIKAKRSALVPLFSQDIPGSRPVLIYKPKDHPTRPYRAIRFTNNTGYSLSRGVTSVFLEGVNVGEGILEDSKPNDTKLIPHQLETGVRVARQQYPVESRLTHINIANGTYVSETVSKVRSTYVIHNKKDEEFRVYLDYDNILGPDSSIDVSGAEELNKRVEKLPSGWRLVITLAALQDVTLEVTETRKVGQSIRLNDNNYFAYLNSAESLKRHPQVVKALALQSAITERQADEKLLAEERAAHLDLQNRVSGHLKNAPEGEKRDKWVSDIDTAETEIRAIDREKAPALTRKIKELREELRRVLNELAADWNWMPDSSPVGVE